MGPRGDVVATAPQVYDETWIWLLCGLVAVLVLGGIGFVIGVWFFYRRRSGRSSAVPQQVPSTAERKGGRERTEQIPTLVDEQNHFFANVSHEFRTPLTLLRGGIEDALDETFGEVPSPLRQRLKHMRAHVNRLRCLADRLLDLSRLQTRELELQPEKRDLVVYLRHLVRAFVPAAERTGVELTLDLGPDTHPCQFDPDKVEKIFGNLISNALRFTPRGGQVTVSFDLEPAENQGAPPIAVIDITDTGRGIADDRQAEVFERFASFRPGERDSSGTGIGLAMAREYTRLHGGTIDVESTVGAGSTFTVRLSLSPVDAEEVQAPRFTSNSPSLFSLVRTTPKTDRTGDEDRPFKAASSDSERPLLLVVDDNADVRAYLRRHLSSLGSVIEASNGAEGLDKVRNADPDLVLANVVMPEMGGRALIRRIRGDETLDRIPILLVTGRAAAEDAVEGLRAGADDYVRKPFSMDELQARIEQLLAARRDWAASGTSDDRLLAPAVDVTPAEEAFLDRVTTVIDDNLSRAEFTVEDLAAGVGVSPRHLQRKVKRLSGHPAGEFVRRYRLEWAAELLAGDAGTVSEIAYSVGFGTPKTFVKHFKEHFGCLPSTYTEQDGK